VGVCSDKDEIDSDGALFRVCAIGTITKRLVRRSACSDETVTAATSLVDWADDGVIVLLLGASGLAIVLPGDAGELAVGEGDLGGKKSIEFIEIAKLSDAGLYWRVGRNDNLDGAVVVTLLRRV